jgi:hypothetical protein
MVSKIDRMLEVAKQYPCPWCNERSGFEVGAYLRSDKWSLAVRSSLAPIVSPVKFMQGVVALGSAGISVHCLSCHQSVGICGYCDHPNRHIGIFPPCSNCKKPLFT